jgi:hypothetical protein
MALLVDDCIWSWNGRRWCHLVSDVDLDELHRFAGAIGLPPKAFHGDHYDLPEELRQGAVDAGASEVSSRELLRRLRAAGLRVRPSQRRSQATATALTTIATTETTTGAA